jgi:anti-anti-sigma regulatory factor
MIIEARDDTITLRGDVKSNIWPAIQAAAALLLANHPTGIIIDASGVAKFTAKGAETFADAFKYISSQNARIIVTGLDPELAEIGKAVPGVRSQVPLADTVEEARASIELEEPTPQRGKAHIAGVAPLVGNWPRAIYHADKLGLGENCEIHLVDLIKVPRTLPIGTPLPERETASRERLDRAKGMVQESGLRSFAHAEHVRSESAGLLQFAERLKADFAVVSLDAGTAEDPHIDESEAMSLAEAPGFEVSLIKGAPAEKTDISGKVVVPAVGSWSHAVEHACKLVRGTEAAVTVVYLITVPRTEPIDARKPDAEAAAADCASEVRRIGKTYGVSIEAITERVRDPIPAFLKMVEAQQYGLCVIGVGLETNGEYSTAKAMADSLLEEVPCEVVFLRVGA